MILARWVAGWLLAYAMRLHAISSGASFLEQPLSIILHARLGVLDVLRAFTSLV